ncbi:MAG: LysM peptidoglycan-binding domain-containing protein [Desulfuromonadales bacterium]|nr:LysM peptidoglycan-binding domain-containing protein [Desulfuromonadales bacterium]
MRLFQLLICLLSGIILTGCFSGAPWSTSSDHAFVPSSAFQQEVADAQDPAAPVNEEERAEVLLADSLTQGIEAEVMLEDVEPLDAETLADNQLLQGEDQLPPEDPGQVLAHEEPIYDFPVVENDKVRYFVDYYSGQAKNTFRTWLERSGRYLPMMRAIFAEAGLPKDLAYLAMVESGFNDKAYSWAHAVGPWQFIESTGRHYGLQNDWWHDERRDPEKATRAAAHFLSDLYAAFDGDWYLAVASYNAGPGKLRQAVKRYNSRDFWELCRGEYLQEETKNYLPKLLAVLMIAKQADKYGFADLEYHEPIAYDTVPLPSNTDLEVIARLSASDYQLIKKLNPELKRWSTPPEAKDYLVRLPVGSKDVFWEAYSRLPKRQRANYARHKVKSGDTLLALAKRHGVRVQDIQRLNGIRNARALQIGTDLIVPLNPDANGTNALAELKDDFKRSRKVSYKVRSGDSLWKISQKFNVTEKQLRVWNRLGWSNVIRPGQHLIVSSKAAPVKTAAVKATSAQRTKSLRQVVYKVRPGDTLWAIGREFAVETGQIRNWNNLAENHVLQPGEQLTLHVSSGSRS